MLISCLDIQGAVVGSKKERITNVRISMSQLQNH